MKLVNIILEIKNISNKLKLMPSHQYSDEAYNVSIGGYVVLAFYYSNINPNQVFLHTSHEKVLERLKELNIPFTCAPGNIVTKVPKQYFIFPPD
jgi:hypothetical protein